MELFKVKSITASTDERLENALNDLIRQGYIVKKIIYLGLNPKTERLYQIVYKE